MNRDLQHQKAYLAQLLEAVQRCAYFLVASQSKLEWPLKEGDLQRQAKDIALFETLAAINERFAKLQDSLAASMRHGVLLMGENPDSFLGVLVFLEKLGALESSERWQQARVVRNMAAHDYETDYDSTARHFNTLKELTPFLLDTARRLQSRLEKDLGVVAHGSFAAEFDDLFR
jgi:hypothetical protein